MDVGDEIGAGGAVAGGAGDIDAVLGVRAGVPVVGVVHRCDATIPSHAQLDLRDQPLAHEGGVELLLAAHQQLDRSSFGVERQHDACPFHAHASLGAETASQIGRDDTQFRMADAQALGDQVALGKGRLAGAPQRHLAVAVHLPDRDMRLQRHVLDVRHAVGVFVDVVGFGPASLHVALAHLEPVADVGAGLAEYERRAGIAVQVRMQQRSSRAGAVFRIKHAWQLFIFDLDQLASALGQLGRLRRHAGYRLPHETDAIDSKGRPVGEIQPCQSGIIRAGDHDTHARQRLRFAGVDACDEAMGNGAALQPAIQQVWPELHIVHILCGAGDLGIALDARERLADDGSFLECHGSLPLCQ